jgi:dTDP-4-amino-4,6-dideoxygalactose transaminase
MKNNIQSLAVLGGSPAFQQPLHVGRPHVGSQERFLERVNQMLQRRWFTNDGPLVQELESGIRDHLNVRHCITTCNGTVALEIAIRASGLRGEVIVPSFTFIATAHALQWQEITPVFADIDPQTHTLDPEHVERMITPRTTGILGVHIWGQPCHTEALQQIAARRNLTLLFDASHAFGCSRRGRRIGNFGRAEVFSFHATKIFHTFEGGAIVTNDDELAAKIRLMKNFGFAGYDNVIYIGTNGKMSEISAAMGLTCLESLDHFIAVNRRHYHQYRDELRGIPGVRLFPHDESEERNYQYIVLEIDADETGIGRDLLVEILHRENVLARRYFYPGCHRMEPYRSHFPHAGLLLPETEALAERVLILPTGPEIGASEISGICRLLRFCCAHGRKLSSLLAPQTLAPALAG